MVKATSRGLADSSVAELPTQTLYGSSKHLQSSFAETYQPSDKQNSTACSLKIVRASKHAGSATNLHSHLVFTCASLLCFKNRQQGIHQLPHSSEASKHPQHHGMRLLDHPQLYHMLCCRQPRPLLLLTVCKVMYTLHQLYGVVVLAARLSAQHSLCHCQKRVRFCSLSDHRFVLCRLGKPFPNSELGKVDRLDPR